MIPIIYPYNETNFTSNGIGRIAECVSCEVTQELNGPFNCELTVPITAKHFDAIKPGNYIYTTHDSTHIPQPFYIYDVTGVDNGCVNVRARHISDKLLNVYLKPFYDGGYTLKQMMQRLSLHLMSQTPFVFSADSDREWTDLFNFGTRIVYSVWDYLRNTEQSDTIFMSDDQSFNTNFIENGFFFRDKWNVVYKQTRGHVGDTYISPKKKNIISYGKSISDIRITTNADDYFNAGIAYYYNYNESTGTEYFLNGDVYQMPNTIDTENPIIRLEDASDYEGGRPTRTDLSNMAISFVRDNYKEIKRTVEANIAFGVLDPGAGYGDYQMERLVIGDVVDFFYAPTNDFFEDISVTKTVYDSLNENYKKMTVGTLDNTYGQVLKGYI